MSIYIPINHLAQLTTPLPMIVIGYQLSQSDLRPALKERNTWISALLRLILTPILSIAMCIVLGLRGAPAIVLAIASSAPAATMASMFAIRYNRDAALASSLVSLQTLMNILTMPIIVGLSQYIFG